MKAKIVTDSGSGLTKKQADALGIGFLPLQILTEDAQYLDGINVDAGSVIELLENGSFPKTSQPSVQDTEDLLSRFEKEGVTDLVTVNISSSLSSTGSQLQAFARQHGITVHPVEPWSTLYVQQHLVLEGLKMLEEGEDPATVALRLQDQADRARTFVVVEDLKHLAAGGRLGPAAAALGSVLRIKPILRLDRDTAGQVELSEKIRTFSRALKKMAVNVQEVIDPSKEYIVFLGDGGSHSLDILEQELEKLGVGKDGNVQIRKGEIFPILLCHTGTGSIGVQILEKPQKDHA